LLARDHSQQSWQAVREERTRVLAALRALGFHVRESQSNFVLAFAPEGASARSLQQRLEERGVLVRHFREPRLEGALRITIGTPQQNETLLELLGELMASTPS
jgi:histidinol-phosphate aminotransferase